MNTINQNNEDNNEMNLSDTLKDTDKSVKFNEGYKIKYSYHSETPKTIRWVIEYSGGLVKNEEQANYVLLGFVVLTIIITLSLIFSGGGDKTNPLPYEKTYKPFQKYE